MPSPTWLILTAMTMEAKALSVEIHSIPVHAIGIKARHLNRVDAKNCRGILLAGLGGALDPALSIGDIILDAPPDGIWANLALPTGKIFTADHLITSLTEKQSLFQTTGCRAVDMEGQIVRDWAQSAAVPFLHVRAVSDRADEALPEGMDHWIDDFGQPRMTQVAADLAFRAYLIPSLMRLQKNSRLALTRLTTTVRQILGAVA